MKKTMFFAALALVIGVGGCGKENTKTIDPDGTVDVTFEISRNEFSDAWGNTRLLVSPGGITRWSPGDQVTVVDHDEGRTGRLFSYLPETARSTGAFSGRLLAGMGQRLYYAYHTPDETDGFHERSLVLTVARRDMAIVEKCQNFNAAYGRHCAMVAIPKEFDAQNPDSDKHMHFHHINSLIEASIASIPTDGRLENVMFDVVEFRITADRAQTPFSTEIKLDMRQITPPPTVSIPFIENDDTKTAAMSTTIEYDTTKRLGDMIANGTATRNFGIPIFALPTTSIFGSTATVDFKRRGEAGDELVLTLEKHSRSDAEGLHLSGLNIINFDETDIKFINQ